MLWFFSTKHSSFILIFDCLFEIWGIFEGFFYKFKISNICWRSLEGFSFIVIGEQLFMFFAYFFLGCSLKEFFACYLIYFSFLFFCFWKVFIWSLITAETSNLRSFLPTFSENWVICVPLKLVEAFFELVSIGVKIFSTDTLSYLFSNNFLFICFSTADL